ncbi:MULTISPECIES: fatty acid desaturase [Rhizobium]|uniref:fatty acid desaturase n=1 Tax=Rhizobium TaxID=379 RepID=UPI001B337ABB|nr:MULTISPECIES: fatty acid desaturase [Rhizobium]MBX4910112.1 fatty acid desaturase [Rhizobium bangladeshense]MBX5217956.1 fatty acid desaturase [Rhizobium sp. NLR9a]MBX5224816.1 fatty acid desaturase [Rhizobium sp. NLR8a]MBX5235747.1 fatty acid desaturase [Rhizobium sp. NLR4a]MBX5248033.1 fatty acid desaturase [Rhizobium sp. NLR3b]
MRSQAGQLHEPFEDSAGAWLKILAKYRQPSFWRSAFELSVTAAPFALLWVGAYASLLQDFWPGYILILPAAAFLLRLFMIQHDCGHGSFFARRKLDTWTGRALGVLTLTPYDYWRQTHAEHHASAGNLDERGIGDITTLTLEEYRTRSRAGRLAYRLYRHPIVMFGIGPAWLFIFKQRLPIGMMQAGALPWVSTMATNAAIAIIGGLLMWTIGPIPFLLVHLPVVLLAGAAGVWLFYVQHQFEETHWSKTGEWKFPRAALHGASHYDLPLVLRWLTGNIGIHHIHHLSSRIPYYRLPEVLRNHPELVAIGRVTLRQSLECVRLALWDEESGRLISFREAESLGPSISDRFMRIV